MLAAMTHPSRVLNLDMKAKALYAKELYNYIYIYIYTYIHTYMSLLMRQETMYILYMYFQMATFLKTGV